jgi:hypothetical protein
MYPILQEGDFCYLSEQVAEKGEIVCLRNKATKEFVIHRLHNKKKLITKGDNSLYWDDPKEHFYIGVIKKMRRGNITTEFKPSLIYSLLSTYTCAKTVKPIRLFIKFIMRII